jgi:cytochrome c oxidase subunit III
MSAVLQPDSGRGSPQGTALWAFIGVATSLFSLFVASYLMRMESPDWSPVALPWQLWVSTGLLVAGRVWLWQAHAAARGGNLALARTMLLAGGISAFAFLGAQLWAWQALLGTRVTVAGNPAGSFFYLLTAMHGLHVAGGLVGWLATWFGDPASLAWRIRLCARYWHFLLAVWVVLFATFAGVTPEVIRFICGTP